MTIPDPKISVIIPVKGEWPHLEACLSSILNSNYLNFDIIVVDDGLSGEAILSLEKYKGKIGILTSGGKGPSYARDLAVKNTDAEFIAFTDSDCIVDKDWLINLLAGFKKYPDAVSCGGKQELPQDTGDFEKKVFLFMKKTGFLTDYMRMAKNNETIEVHHNASCNVMYKKGAFLKEGGFLENLWPGEDVEFDYRLTRKKYKMVFNPQAIVYHYRPKDLKSFSKMMYRYGWAQGFLVKKYGIYRKIQLLPLFSATFLLSLLLLIFLQKTLFALYIVLSAILITLYYFRLNLNILSLSFLAFIFWNSGFMGYFFGFRKRQPRALPQKVKIEGLERK